MQTIHLDGGEQAVLLLHGLQSSPAKLQPLAKRLNQAGYTVHVPHLGGYGFITATHSHALARMTG